MLPLAADENFNNDILRGLLHKNPKIDIVRIQDTEIQGMDDPTVLEWCAREHRILLTHDVQTMTKYSSERVQAGLYMPGVFEVNLKASFAKIIDDLLVLIECSNNDEWEAQIVHVPLH